MWVYYILKFVIFLWVMFIMIFMVFNCRVGLLYWGSTVIFSTCLCSVKPMDLLVKLVTSCGLSKLLVPWHLTCWSCVRHLLNDLISFSFSRRLSLEKTLSVLVSDVGTYSVVILHLSLFTVLDFSDLYQMSCVLSEAGLASDVAFTIKEYFSAVPGLKSLSEVSSISE